MVRLARNLVERCRILTSEINELEHEISDLVEQLVLTLLAVVGVGPLTAAKILARPPGRPVHVQGRYAR